MQEPAPAKCVLLSTSAAVRVEMRGWSISDEGDRWSVKLDCRDLGGHLDATFRAWRSSLALPLDDKGKLRVLRTKFIPAALRGFEVSLLSRCAWVRLRAVFARAALYPGMPLAHIGTVLGVLDGQEGSDPGYCEVWFRFRLLRRSLAYRFEEFGKGFQAFGFSCCRSSWSWANSSSAE